MSQGANTRTAAGALWPNGVAVPLITPFSTTPERLVDHSALASQVVRVAQAGCGIVLLGTNGEGTSFRFQHSLITHLACSLAFISKRTDRSRSDWSESFE